MDIEKLKSIYLQVGKLEQLPKVLADCKSKKSYLFDFGDCLAILKPIDVDGCACVHIESAYSDRKNGFSFGYHFISERAKEIGAKYITFSTANKGIERLSIRHGWAKINQVDNVSSWIIEI